MESMKCTTIKYTNHAIEYMAKRGIVEEEAEKVLHEGMVIEEYVNDKPFPSRLILSFIDERPIHLVLAYDEETATCFVITAYEPNLEKFEIDFKTRKKKP